MGICRLCNRYLLLEIHRTGLKFPIKHVVPKTGASPKSFENCLPLHTLIYNRLVADRTSRRYLSKGYIIPFIYLFTYKCVCYIWYLTFSYIFHKSVTPVVQASPNLHKTFQLDFAGTKLSDGTHMPDFKDVKQATLCGAIQSSVKTTPRPWVRISLCLFHA